MAGANFEVTALTSSQLYSTASYQAKDLQGVWLAYDDLTGWNLVGQNLTDANLNGATRDQRQLDGGRPTRGILGRRVVRHPHDHQHHTPERHDPGPAISIRSTPPSSSATITPSGGTGGPIPIHILTGMSMDSNATLQFQLDGGTWGSTISFDAGIPVTLGGNIELGLAPGVDPSSLVGDTWQLFDWTGVSPSGRSRASSTICRPDIRGIQEPRSSSAFIHGGAVVPSLATR